MLMKEGPAYLFLGRERQPSQNGNMTFGCFEDQNPPVIVEIESEWLFDLDAADEQYPSSFEKYDEATAVMLRNAYRAIIRQLPGGGASNS
jgi:hypothetical protein